MTLFDAYLAVDWSASAKQAPAKPSRDAILVGERVVAQDRTPVFEHISLHRGAVKTGNKVMVGPRG